MVISMSDVNYTLDETYEMLKQIGVTFTDKEAFIDAMIDEGMLVRDEDGRLWATPSAIAEGLMAEVVEVAR